MYQSFLDSKEVYQILNGDMQVSLHVFVLWFFHSGSLCWPLLHYKDKQGKTLSQVEDFQEQDFAYSLFNLLTDEYQFASLAYRSVFFCTPRSGIGGIKPFFGHVNFVKPLIA